MKTIITTGGRPDLCSEQLAKEAAETLGYPVINRKKRSIVRMQEEYGAACLIAGKDRFELYRIGMEKPFFFHPNSAAFRAKRLLAGETDPLIEVAKLQRGMTFLDCTLGLASDSIIASLIVGERGWVTGVEMDRDIAFITERGLRSFPSDSVELTDAMRRVHVIQSDAVAFLASQREASWDVVYVDPMFSTPISESTNFTPLRQVGTQSSLTQEWMEQAFRVCKERVIVKNQFDSPVFTQFGLEQFIRPNTKFHFGAIEK